MRFISEAQSASLVSHELAFDAVRRALIAAVAPGTTVFPAVNAHGSNLADQFTIKSGADGSLAGLKVGSYWPGNNGVDVPRHHSTILLLDQTTGRIGAVVEGGAVNAYRTAAADAVAADALARQDSRVLTVFGTGHQAGYEVQAVCRVRAIDTVLVVGRSAERTAAFISGLAGRGIAAARVDAETGCRRADVVICATTATSPLFDARWIRPGTHVVSMGSDTAGAQELPPELLRAADLFCDLPEQSLRIGEFQHVAAEVSAGEISVTAIGSVLTGRAPGRRDHEQITVFDSSGIAIQDLYVGAALLAAADRASGVAT